jgi:hypothetical protein
VFFDDILVYSKDTHEHKLHLMIVLDILRTNKFKVKFNFIGQHQVEYMGHIISGLGVATDPSKIYDIIKWETPITLKKLRGFLGLTGYYRRFIQSYATICQPVYLVPKKDNFVWGP